ncbi:MAG TPA: acyl carrier protein [Longimicrobium sp.]|nr:acyl carrier protein [Longimicrobium sp.]
MKPELLVSRVLGVPAQQLSDSTSNAQLGTWDSLAHITLVLEIESTYGVSVSVEEALGMTSVGAIKQVLAQRGVRW